MSRLDSVTALLFDLDGVFYEGETPILGGAEVLNALIQHQTPYGFITNTTTRSRRQLADKLQLLGLPAEDSQIVTAPVATALYLQQKGYQRCRLVVNESVKGDFAGISDCADDPDCVVLGDIGSAWDYSLINMLFQQVMAGAHIVAMHKNRFWKTEQSLQLDIGGFVAALEYATGCEAQVVGKPSNAFFLMALQSLPQTGHMQTAVVGDDIDNDVGAAQSAGLAGVLVKTGKYRPDIADSSGVKPDAVISSIADLPELLPHLF